MATHHLKLFMHSSKSCSFEQVTKLDKSSGLVLIQIKPARLLEPKWSYGDKADGEFPSPAAAISG